MIGALMIEVPSFCLPPSVSNSKFIFLNDLFQMTDVIIVAMVLIAVTMIVTVEVVSTGTIVMIVIEVVTIATTETIAIGAATIGMTAGIITIDVMIVEMIAAVDITTVDTTVEITVVVMTGEMTEEVMIAMVRFPSFWIDLTMMTRHCAKSELEKTLVSSSLDLSNSEHWIFHFLRCLEILQVYII